ncbi:hypothetical protein [Noviherbaspirillum galbum]|uniref:Uncharacterized protein n=1 Tax=Noviherbaspirillum galbum TaxID=2709383 RepID=A0A6B3SRE5_9BURK|nr:hypothetical protein [Noviherbaspirillum galbum]NEX60229.1 hypothetical protein [Noviherbaspirillum galbum]
MNIAQHCQLSGKEIRRLMRVHRITIDAIATRYDLTKKRVREVRMTGVSGFLASEWHFLITGIWLH